jgi:hypothetical protein
MTIRNIDMQVLIPKVTDVARLQNDQQQLGISRQNEFAQQIQNQAARMEQTVAQPNKNEDVYVQEKQERGRREKKKNRGDNQEPGSDAEPSGSGSKKTLLVPKIPHKIDIKI